MAKPAHGKRNEKSPPAPAKKPAWAPGDELAVESENPPNQTEARAEFRAAALGTPRGPDASTIERAAKMLAPITKYCRLEVEGWENIPAGGAILAANHTGWVGLDNANLVLAIHDRLKRVPRTAVHPAFFRTTGIADLMRDLGCFEVSVHAASKLLDAGELVTVFPEAEEGNFKPLWKHYELEAFKPGFARIALATGAPVVPTVILGGEEANPSLGRIDATKKWIGLALPVPLNLFPFPVKWRIAFLPPQQPAKYEEAASTEEQVAETWARDLRETMQAEVWRQYRKRGNPWV
ncbi:MAG: 1-acyl-sn-glycerol-3-phosphate acyltransferase [Thermoplasmatota archaeon]